MKDAYVAHFVKGHKKLLDEVRAELRTRGPLGNRDFDGKRVQSWSYRGRKESAVALFDMWLSGELMMHHRVGFDRVYDFREKIAPKEFDYVATDEEAIEFFVRKAVSFAGLKREATIRSDLNYHLRREFSRVEMESLLGGWKESGMLTQVQIETGRDIYLVLGEDVKVLESLEGGVVLKSWNPKETTTLDEVTFLAPLDIVSARGRAAKLFNFEYKWEVYTPASKRRWGYYVLPILYGDELVGRLDPKLDRTTMTLEIKGFWLEDGVLIKDDNFLNALVLGLIRFARFLNINRLELPVKSLLPVKRQLKKKVKTNQLDLTISG